MNFKLYIIVFGAADFISDYKSSIIITIYRHLVMFLIKEIPSSDVRTHSKNKNDRVDAYGSPHKSLSIQDSKEGRLVKLEES